MDAEKNVRALLKAKADEVPSAPVIPEAVLRRSKIRRSLSATLASAILIAVSAGALAGVRSLVEKPRLEPVNPAPSVTENSERNAQEDRNLSQLRDSAECAVGHPAKTERGSGSSSRKKKTARAPLVPLGPLEWFVALLGTTSITSSSSTCGYQGAVKVPPQSGPPPRETPRPRSAKNK